MPELIVLLRGRELQRFPILLAETTIGRDESCDIVLDNAGISRTHARVSYRSGEFHVRDLDSQNGFTLNGKRTLEAQLQYGDVLAFNKFEIHFSADGGVPPELLESAVKPAGPGARNIVATMTLNAEAARKLQAQVLAQKKAAKTQIAAPRRSAIDPAATPTTHVRWHLWLATTVLALSALAAVFLHR